MTTTNESFLLEVAPANNEVVSKLELLESIASEKLSEDDMRDFYEDAFHAVLGLLQGSEPDFHGSAMEPPAKITEPSEARCMLSDFVLGYTEVIGDDPSLTDGEAGSIYDLDGWAGSEEVMSDEEALALFDYMTAREAAKLRDYGYSEAEIDQMLGTEGEE